MLFRSPLLGNRHIFRRQTHRLPRPLEPNMNAYPLMSLTCCDAFSAPSGMFASRFRNRSAVPRSENRRIAQACTRQKQRGSHSHSAPLPGVPKLVAVSSKVESLPAPWYSSMPGWPTCGISPRSCRKAEWRSLDYSRQVSASDSSIPRTPPTLLINRLREFLGRYRTSPGSWIIKLRQSTASTKN